MSFRRWDSYSCRPATVGVVIRVRVARASKRPADLVDLTGGLVDFDSVVFRKSRSVPTAQPAETSPGG